MFDIEASLDKKDIEKIFKTIVEKIGKWMSEDKNQQKLNTLLTQNDTEVHNVQTLYDRVLDPIDKEIDIQINACSFMLFTSIDIDYM
jgi:hypothetical protein